MPLINHVFDETQVREQVTLNSTYPFVEGIDGSNPFAHLPGIWLDPDFTRIGNAAIGLHQKYKQIYGKHKSLVGISSNSSIPADPWQCRAKIGPWSDPGFIIDFNRGISDRQPNSIPILAQVQCHAWQGDGPISMDALHPNWERFRQFTPDKRNDIGVVNSMQYELFKLSTTDRLIKIAEISQNFNLLAPFHPNMISSGGNAVYGRDCLAASALFSGLPRQHYFFCQGCGGCFPTLFASASLYFGTSLFLCRWCANGFCSICSTSTKYKLSNGGYACFYCTFCEPQQEHRSTHMILPRLANPLEYINTPRLKNSVYYFGLELEVEKKRGRPPEVWADLGAKLSKVAILKHDGSLQDGAEICSIPMSHRKHIETWQSILDDKIMNEFNADLASRAGLHIHFSRAPTTTAQIVRLYGFWINRQHRKWLTALAGRQPNEYCQYLPRSAEYLGKSDMPRNKYDVINVMHKNSYEVRAFQSTRIPQKLFARIELVHALVDFCGLRSNNDMLWSVFRDWLTAYPQRKLHKYLLLELREIEKNMPSALEIEENE